MGTLAVIESCLLLLDLATAAMLSALWQELNLAYYFSAQLQQLCCWHSGSHCVWLTTSRPGNSSCVVGTLAVIVSRFLLPGLATAAVLWALLQSLCLAYYFSAQLQQLCCGHSGSHCVWLTTSRPCYSSCVVGTLVVIGSGLLVLSLATAAVTWALWQSLSLAYYLLACLQQMCCRHSGRN